MLVGDIIRINAEIYPEKKAILDGESYLTYSELNKKINKIANGLLEIGVTHGSRVAIIDKNSIDYVAVYYAVAKIGAIIVPINFWLRGHEIAAAINHVNASHLFVGEDFIERVQEIYTSKSLPSIKKLIGFSTETPNYMITFDNLLLLGNTHEPNVHVKDTDPHEIIFTSGTTGKPKGSIRNHKSFILEALAMANILDIKHEDTMLMYLPMFHIGGGNVPKMFYLVGGTVSILPQFNPKHVLQTIERHQVTWSIFVPATIRMLIDDPDFKHYNVSTLKKIDIGGSPVPKPLLEDIMRYFPSAGVYNGYGMTECTWISVLRPVDSERKLGSIGKPVLGVEMKIKGTNGNIQPPGKIGEIVIKSDTVMQGYWNDNEKTNNTIKDGWLHTGDLGVQDNDGYFYVVDRIKDVIISGGENVSSLEVENVLLTHPSISEAAVIGIADPVYTEKVVAVIKLKDGKLEVTEEDILQYCRPKLAGFKNPKKVFFVRELPKTAMNKISKKDLRDIFSEKVGNN